MTTFKIQHAPLIRGKKTEVLVHVDSSSVHWGNNGIGAYEYWGAKGFDKGTDYIEEFEVEEAFDPDTEEKFPDEVRKAIEYVLQDDIDFLTKLEDEFRSWASDMRAEALCQED